MNPQKENPFFNLLFNILIPVLILNKGHLFLQDNAGAQVLIIALLFPVFYGLFDLLKNKRKNIISLFGVLNVLLTGGFALYKLSGIWFAVKEATFPLLIGVFVLGSAYTKKNLFEYLIRSSSLLQWDRVDEKIQAFSATYQLKKLFKQSTILFSISFFISAILNFVLAMYIFSKDPVNTSGTEVANTAEVILNQKIADITWLGFLVIGVPMTFFAVGIFWRFLKRLSQLTGFSTDDLLITKPK